jgi:hypothetical protein
MLIFHNRFVEPVSESLVSHVALWKQLRLNHWFAEAFHGRS